MHCEAERQVGQVTILDIGGQVTLGNIEAKITKRIRELMQTGHKSFVLNLEAVTSIDSHGLGDLVAAREAASREGAAVKLLSVRPRVHRPLKVMNLLRFFELFESEDEAVQSFS